MAIVNGPGEVAGWMLPVVERLKSRSPESRVTVVLTPCQFASGREREVIAASPAVDETMTFGEFVHRRWRDGRAGARRENPRTLVMHFGGDPFYAMAASVMLRAPAWRYGTSSRGLMRTERYLVPDERTRAKLVGRGIDPARVTVVGQLVVDSVPREALKQAQTGRRVGDPERVVIMPGSRRFELAFMLPFYEKVLDELHARRPGATFTMPIAPFVDRDLFVAIATSAGYRFDVREDGVWLVTPRGASCRVVEGDPYAEVRAADLAVTLPGTNTLQLAVLGVPYVVLLPLNRGENIPLEGLLGWVLPSVRPLGLFRRYLTWWMNRRIGFVALPNIMASEPVVPELRGVLDPADVAGAIVDLLADPARREALADRLREIAGPPGAADRAAAALLTP